MSKDKSSVDFSCRKVCFESEKVACATLKRINDNPKIGQGTALKSVYYCSDHKAWHLSSMSAKMAQSIAQKKIEREEEKKPSLDQINNRMEYLKKVPRIRNHFKKL